MWTVLLFLTSLVLIGVFVALHVWESKRQKRLFEHTRSVWDVRLMRLYHAAVSGNIPTEWRKTARVLLHTVTHSLVVFLVETLRAIERPLAQLSHRLRTHAPSGNGKEVSPFLKTLSPEKKNESEEPRSTT
ncbi:hypothetical protein A2841_03770 [Candidatus Kaiserbacteria bacterium RIFCSPHIGHO2_01_FULL_48_10]|uniref:Uncharacterized protein n=1 Tax=Candidatus Kaiserbacteria bacterium RIFCSPHIGHO2_01_FULL_48_10 TaxID=1798476 RepID=A0A1F6C464_9BACT|nr:MAG: hypothetical protein A2841_03770 [Candidatus Kaiserbacteria bacterium RIFCSPHIGHO2_01_FULL_48_10]